MAGTSFVIVCPVTGTIKDHPFEVALPDGLPISGAVLADQIKCMNRQADRFEFGGKAPGIIVQDVQAADV